MIKWRKQPMDKTIRQVSPDQCTGCGACYNKCPVDAIVMEYDNEGFIFPRITDACIDCGQCANVCPVIKPMKLHDTPLSYAVMASDEVRLKSSSGGMFTLLANYILEKGGAVCGAAYTDDYQYVHHIWAETKEDLAPLRGSKYVQSDTEKTYRQAKEYLEQDRIVLYTGCPCQIAGLYQYLGKDYENLYTADIICHGVNSSTAYQSFIKEFSEEKEIEKVDFRNKEFFDWSMPTVVYLKDGTVKKAAQNESYWNIGAQSGIFSRLSCHSCAYASKERVADLTMGDCWQVGRYNKDYDDSKGTSLVLVNTRRGRKLFEDLQSNMKLCQPVPLDEMSTYNQQLNVPAPIHECRKFFFSHLDEMGYHKALWYGRGMRFDVGLVGWWFASNYGSSLTYYALGTILERMGKQVLMIPIAKTNGTPWEPEIKYTVDFLSKYFRVGRDRAYDKMHEFNQFCDSFMLGSDQMWTGDSTKLVGYTFFLDFADRDKKKIAFSTSFGRGDFYASEEMTKTAGDFLRRFDAISVREKSGVDVCKNRFGIDAQQIMDPVFLCSAEEYNRIAGQVHEPIRKKYLLCYILDPTPEKEAAAKAIAAHEGLDILTVLGLREYEHAKENWHTGTVLPRPTSEQFLYYIKNCSYLLTDSHHGTCFGIIYKKPYAALVNASRGSTRFETVAQALGLENRLFWDPKDICESKRPYATINYDAVSERMEAEKQRALQWLESALTCPTKIGEETVRTVKAAYERRLTVQTQTANALKWQVDRNAEEISQLHKALEAHKQGKPGAATPAPSEAAALNSNPDFIKIRILATLLRDYGVKHVVLSPGGRDVPLVRIFEYNDDQFILHRVTDERSAAYFGLGIAAQLQQPVVCVCTSGTAVSNYLPAVTEAYYTGVPLIMVTADRREVYHNHGEDQTIPQKDVFGSVVKKAFSVPEASGYQADYQTRRDISDCILEATHNGFGPVHINITVDNIGMGAKLPKEHWKLLPRINPHLLRVSYNDGEDQLMKWVDALKKSKRILVVYGQNPPATKQQLQNIQRFASKFNCVIATDFLSNLSCKYTVKPYNMLRAISQQEFNEQLAPDILISVGGKTLMNDPLLFKVRSGPGSIRHWGVTPDGKVKDFYFKETSVIEMSQDRFFEWFADHAGHSVNNGDYCNAWKQKAQAYTAPAVDNFNSHYIQSKFIPAVPANALLHLGVGQSFFDTRKYVLDPSVEVFCNMGTNGIDGCTSTFMGQCAVVKNKLCFLLVGDLSFFYDMNGIWNKQLNKNIRILMVNNNGTGLLRGHNLKAISSVHNTEAKGWVESTGFAYMCARSKKEFDEKLAYFISNKSDKALFFEVFCD